MGMLAYLLDSLDKPRAGLVGALATGDPAQLQHWVPFGETLGITDPNLRNYSGREMLEANRIIGPNTPGLDWGDVGGFVADLALDPTDLLTGGALQAARRAEAAEDYLRQAGQRVPLADDAWAAEIAGGGGLEEQIAHLDDLEPQWQQAAQPAMEPDADELPLLDLVDDLDTDLEPGGHGDQNIHIQLAGEPFSGDGDSWRRVALTEAVTGPPMGGAWRGELVRAAYPLPGQLQLPAPTPPWPTRSRSPTSCARRC